MASVTTTCTECGIPVTVEFSLKIGATRKSEHGITVYVEPIIPELDAVIAEHRKLHVEPIG